LISPQKSLVLIASSKIEKAAWIRDLMLALFALGIKPSAALALSPHEQRRLQRLAHSQQLGYQAHHSHAHTLTPIGDIDTRRLTRRTNDLDEACAEFGQQRSVIKSGWLYKKGFINQTWKRRWCVLMPNAILYYQTQSQLLLCGTIDLDGRHVQSLESARSELARQQGVVKGGWLYKRGDQRQNWTRRYFELNYGNAHAILHQQHQPGGTGSGGAVTPVTLSYYTSPELGLGRVRKCKGRIQLKGRSVVHVAQHGAGNKNHEAQAVENKPHPFDLSSTFFGEFNENNEPGRTYHIHASSAAEMAGWLAAIESAINLANSTPEPVAYYRPTDSGADMASMNRSSRSISSGGLRKMSRSLSRSNRSRSRSRSSTGANVATAAAAPPTQAEQGTIGGASAATMATGIAAVGEGYLDLTTLEKHPHAFDLLPSLEVVTMNDEELAMLPVELMRTYHFYTSSKADQAEWLDAFTIACKGGDGNISDGIRVLGDSNSTTKEAPDDHMGANVPADRAPTENLKQFV
jgi:hypothetical protein